VRTITVDMSMRSQLDNLDSPLELCDESGARLGFFLPSADRQRALYDQARAAFSDEDIERARQQTGGATTEEVLSRLRNG
jgi:hypothetical protein